MGKRVNRSLDLEDIVRQRVRFGLLVRLLLSKKQQVLFRYQRKRLIPLSGQDTESESSLDLAKTQLRALYGFQIRSKLDKKLLKGIFKKSEFKAK